MADYQLRARIPQETADKLFEVMKDLQERTEGADVTISSVIRQAVDDYIKSKEDLNVTVPAKRLKSAEAKRLYEMFESLEGEENTYEIRRFLAMLNLKLIKTAYELDKLERPEFYKFMEIDMKENPELYENLGKK